MSASDDCSLCQGLRWIRIQGQAARAYGHEELKAVCPACNSDGGYRVEPADWGAVVVVAGCTVDATEGRR